MLHGPFGADNPTPHVWTMEMYETLSKAFPQAYRFSHRDISTLQAAQYNGRIFVKHRHTFTNANIVPYIHTYLRSIIVTSISRYIPCFRSQVCLFMLCTNFIIKGRSITLPYPTGHCQLVHHKRRGITSIHRTL
jgi:hypothetical protein